MYVTGRINIMQSEACVILRKAFKHVCRKEVEEARAAYLMVKTSLEEDLTSSQQFIQALQFAGWATSSPQ
jgi:hypothetical protein